MGADGRIRLFYALVLEADTRDCIAEWQREHLPADARGVRPDDLHITLAFLGHRPPDEVPRLAQELREAARAARAPELRLRRYLETPRVGMLVLEELEVSHATSLAYDLQSRATGLGIPLRERRPWKPHITVWRFRERAGAGPALPNMCSINVVRSALYRSTLGPGGSRYDALETAALGGRKRWIASRR